MQQILNIEKTDSKEEIFAQNGQYIMVDEKYV